MRRYAVILLLVAIAVAGRSQIYTFEKGHGDYKSLEDAVQISGAVPWEDNIFALPIGFDFNVYGRKFDSCYLQQGSIFFNIAPDRIQAFDTAIIFFTFMFNLYDLGVDSAESLSPVKYRTTGDPGNRIFIIEYNDAWVDDDNPVRTYIDFQIWLYEYNGTIEVHYGPFHYPYEWYFLHFLGLSKLATNDLDTVVVEQTRLILTDDWILIDDFDDPFALYGFIPADGDIYRFLMDRDIVLNPMNNLTLMSELGQGGEIIDLVGGLLGETEAHIGHGSRKEYEWAERYILEDSVVLKGLVSQHYGFVTDNDSAYYNIYRPRADLLPGESILEKKVAFMDLDLNAGLNILSFDPPLVLKDTFFLAFGVPPYDDYSDNIIGTYIIAGGYDLWKSGFGRTAARWMDGKWYDMYTSMYLTAEVPDIQDPRLNAFHLSIAPVLNFFTGNLNPIAGDLKALGQPLGTAPSIKMRNLRLYPHFPNPADQTITIQFENTTWEPVSLNIYRTDGALVYSIRVDAPANCQTQHTIDVNSWAHGEYVYILQTANDMISSVFIKQ